MKVIIMQIISLALALNMGFWIGRLYELRFGFWKKHADTWRDLAFDTLHKWGEATLETAKLLESKSKRADGSVPSPFFRKH